MNNLLRKILLIAAVVSAFMFLGSGASAANLEVQFESGPPLFNEANFLPGGSVSRWIKVTNNSGLTQTIAIKAVNYFSPLPSDDLSRVLKVEIKQESATLYGPVLLSKFYEDSGLPDDEKVVVLSDLNNGGTVQYDITISFPSEADDEWQGKTTDFDIVAGFKQAGEPSPSPTTTTLGVSGGGGTGGWYFLTPTPTPMPTVAGEATTGRGQETGGLARGGIIGGASATGETGETPSPSPGAMVAGKETSCRQSPWWPFGYVLLLIILGAAQKMEKKVSVGGIVLQVALLIAALLWWWLEPCGARFWVWPVLILVVFLVSLRFYLKKSSSEETPA